MAAGIALVAAPQALAAAQNPRALVRRLRDHCASMPDLSGAVLLAKDGRPILRSAFGQRHRGEHLPNRPDTKFNIASIGKLFTSLSIMRFVQSGRIRLEDRLIAHWPDYPNRAVAESVTIAQLLTHTAGLGNNALGLTRAQAPLGATQSEIVAAFAAAEPDGPAGGAFSYSNDGYIVLGALIERLSGRPFTQHCSETIFAPLGMRNTSYSRADSIVENIARAYTRDLEHPGVWQDVTDTLGVPGSAAGGAFSTCDDLLVFANALQRNQVLPRELTDTWTAGRIDYPRGRYGYGVSEETINGHRIIGHSGGHYGIACELMIFNDFGYTFIVLMNGEVDAFWDVNNWIKRELVGENDGVRDYDFTRALIDALIADPARARAFYAARDPSRRARESVIDVYGYKTIHQGQRDAGLALLGFNLETFPDSASALWSMAEALRLNGARADAIAAYNAYLAKFPDDADAIAAIARLQR